MNSFKNVLNTIPRVETFPEYNPNKKHDGIDFSGIKTISYDGINSKGQKTKVFAHIGFPDTIKEPIPAVVLVHGGGGHPDDVWIKKWNDRGYAAIAMDTTGFFPTKPIPHLYEGFCDGLERKLVAPFYEEGYTVSPNNSEMTDFDLPLYEQWMYHAVSQVILAHNILRDDDKIDSNKIGIVGISWGGVITSLAIGIDTRFAFAIPIYGSGYLSSGHSYISNIFKNPNTYIWCAEKNFSNVKIPVMWLCWNDDCCFSVNSNSMSYLDTKSQNCSTCLSICDSMMHSHYHGYSREESYWFADAILSGEKIPQTTADCLQDKIKYFCSIKPKRVRLFYIESKMLYKQRVKYNIDNQSFMAEDWKIIELNANENIADMPNNAIGKYIEFTLPNDIVLTTPYTETLKS